MFTDISICSSLLHSNATYRKKKWNMLRSLLYRFLKYCIYLLRNLLSELTCIHTLVTHVLVYASYTEPHTWFVCITSNTTIAHLGLHHRDLDRITVTLTHIFSIEQMYYIFSLRFSSCNFFYSKVSCIS